MQKKLVKTAVWVLLVGIMLGGASVAFLAWQIHHAVRECCASAQKAFPESGDDVIALIQVMTSDQFSFKERNRAVWALGRIRDPQCLPFLKAAYTGEPCDHERFLCQYELEKAIKRCGGIPEPPRKKGH